MIPHPCAIAISFAALVLTPFLFPRLAGSFTQSGRGPTSRKEKNESASRSRPLSSVKSVLWVSCSKCLGLCAICHSITQSKEPLGQVETQLMGQALAGRPVNAIDSSKDGSGPTVAVELCSKETTTPLDLDCRVHLRGTDKARRVASLSLEIA